MNADRNVDRNKEVVRRYADLFSQGAFDRIADLCTPGVLIQGVLGAGGLDVVLPVWRELHAAFAPRLAIEDIVAEGDRVAVRLRESGTFRGAFRGKQPTGRSYEVVAMEWFRMEDGRIAERWGARDSAAIMRQIEAAA